MNSSYHKTAFRRFYLFRLNRNHVDELPHFEVSCVAHHTLVCEAHETIRCGEECIVGTAAHIEAWANRRSALTDENVARFGKLTREFFDTKPLSVGIAAVPGGTFSHLMGHSFEENAYISGRTHVLEDHSFAMGMTGV